MLADDPTWVDRMMAVLAAAEPSPGPVVARHSLWSSRRTGRRGTVLWAQDGQVCLSFSENNPKASVVLAESTLLNSYIEIK